MAKPMLLAVARGKPVHRECSEDFKAVTLFLDKFSQKTLL